MPLHGQYVEQRDQLNALRDHADALRRRPRVCASPRREGEESTMSTKTDERRAYVEAILNRLRRQYVERVPTPGDGEPLTFEMLQRLCHHIVSEGYGE
jgi:hypothetical protein